MVSYCLDFLKFTWLQSIIEDNLFSFISDVNCYKKFVEEQQIALIQKMSQTFISKDS